MQMQIFVTDLVLVTMWLNPFKKNFFWGGGLQRNHYSRKSRDKIGGKVRWPIGAMLMERDVLLLYFFLNFVYLFVCVLVVSFIAFFLSFFLFFPFIL